MTLPPVMGEKAPMWRPLSETVPAYAFVLVAIRPKGSKRAHHRGSALERGGKLYLVYPARREWPGEWQIEAWMPMPPTSEVERLPWGEGIIVRGDP